MNTISKSALDDVWLCVQGPTKYVEQMCEAYSGYPRKVWATWHGEPHIDLLDAAGFHVVFLDKPENRGHQNVNLQCVSAFRSIIEAHSRGAKYALKVRHDLVFSDLEKMLEICLQKEHLTFLCYHDHRGGYLVDYFNFGKIDEIERWWRMQTMRKDACSEVYQLEHYLRFWGLPVDRSCKKLKEYFSFVIEDMVEHDISANWLSRNLDISQYLNYRHYHT